MIMQNYKKQ